MKRLDAKRASVVQSGVSSFHAAAEIYRSRGQIELAAQCESNAAYGRRTLIQMKNESRPKMLGALHGKVLPGAFLYLVCLEEYIAAKIGRKPLPSEIAHILSALLTGFNRLPDVGIDPDLFAKRSKQFRERNPLLIEEMKRKTSCDPSGNNLLDHIYGKAFIADRI